MSKDAWEVGMLVKVAGFHEIGTIISLNAKQAEIAFEHLKVRVKLETLQPAQPPAPSLPNPYRKKFKHLNASQEAFNPEVDLHGMTVDYALKVVGRLIDQALLRDIAHLKIIHGKGEGVLRKAVKDYLLKHKHVRKVVNNHPFRGGSGVTFAVLK